MIKKEGGQVIAAPHSPVKGETDYLFQKDYLLSVVSSISIEVQEVNS